MEDKELLLLRSLMDFPKREDDSGRYRLGRIVKEEELPFLEALIKKDLIVTGIDTKAGYLQSTMSITRTGESKYYKELAQRTRMKGGLVNSVKACFYENKGRNIFLEQF